MKLTARQFKRAAESIPDFYDPTYINKQYVHVIIIPEIEIVPQKTFAPQVSRRQDSELIFKRGRYDWEIEL